MFCPKCGNKVPDEAAFCGKCGNQIRKQEAVTNPKVSDEKSKSPALGENISTNETSSLGAIADKKMILAIVAIAVIVVVVIVAIVSCSALSGKSSSGNTAPSSAYSSNQNYSSNSYNSSNSGSNSYSNTNNYSNGYSSSKSTSTNNSSGGNSVSNSTLIGMWKDPDYSSDYMTVAGDGSVVINQDDVRVSGSWKSTSDGMVVTKGRESLTFVLGSSNGKPTLYNSEKQLYYIKAN